MINKISIITLSLTLSLSFLASEVSAAKFYKWVDENGVTHYTPTPPPNTDAQTVKTFTGRSTPVEPATEEKTTGDEAATDQTEGADAKDPNAETDKKQKPASTKNPQACKKAKDDLEKAQQSAILREKDKDGNIKVINKEDKLKSLRDQIKKNC